MRDSFECSITQICEQLGVTQRAVRLYEAQGLLTVRRDRFNCRRYSLPVRERLRIICALRSVGLGLAEIRQILDGGETQGPADATRQTQIHRLTEVVRQRLEWLRSQMRLAEILLRDVEEGVGPSRGGAETPSSPTVGRRERSCRVDDLSASQILRPPPDKTTPVKSANRRA